MRRSGVLVVCLGLAVLVSATCGDAWAQQKKLVYWTHWEQNAIFNKWFETKGKEFAKKTGYEVEVVTIPYQGYEAKYLAAFMARSGAPDFFNGMAHHWCGQYDFCDKMPTDLAKTWDENLPKHVFAIGTWNNVRYGYPVEIGNITLAYINVDMFKKAGLDPNRPLKTYDEWLAAAKKLTILDAKGVPVQVGFGIRHKGHPVGTTNNFLAFAHAWGARLLSPNLDKATGYANSPEMVAALTFLGDLVLKYKVASVALGSPEDSFGQKRAAMMFRESWFFGWLRINAPDVNFNIHSLPCEKACPGIGTLFPWANLVYKQSPNKQVVWEFIRFISNAKDDLEQHELQGMPPVWISNQESAYAKSRPDYQAAKEMAAQPVAPIYFHPKSNELATVFGEAIGAVLYGKGQPKAVLDEAATKMDKILKD